MKLRSLGRSQAHKINCGRTRSAEVDDPMVPLPLSGLRLNTKASEQTATQMLAAGSTNFFLATFEYMRLRIASGVYTSKQNQKSYSISNSRLTSLETFLLYCLLN
jgi:hypothetical protein